MRDAIYPQWRKINMLQLPSDSLMCPSVNASSGQRPIHAVTGPTRIFADRLLKLVVNLPLKGIERSLKCAPGQLFDQRFLLGLAPACWRPELLSGIRSELGMPPAMWELFAQLIGQANFLGLAFELGANGCVYKAYLEFPVLVARHQYQPNGNNPPALLYKGFKWQPTSSEHQVFTDYHWTPQLPRDAIEMQLRTHLAPLTHATVRTLVDDIVEQACTRTSDQGLTCLEVSEAMTSRSSFDLNVYPAGISVAQITGRLTDVGQQFGLDSAQLASALKADKDQILGHISAGCDRNGQDFLTLYYDVT